ncbi:hypothetical protein [Deinococcus multiflagellatus]|uniref:Uncharacterized protein n=1 Tax=Deinococcus multiflagellatus TaxID=1656887 RepID=A0ABW1ZP42_9DEIO|nr:hypothetical protein [Deinococcus multiflagellatus]MBZ9715840.1 hypothetical protein [Deinococcus multiflagellatus]
MTLAAKHKILRDDLQAQLPHGIVVDSVSEQGSEALTVLLRSHDPSTLQPTQHTLTVTGCWSAQTVLTQILQLLDDGWPQQKER